MPLFFESDFFLEARAEILKNRLFFGRNDDIINSFRNLLTFSTALLLKNPMEDWTFSIWEKIENRGIICQYHKKNLFHLTLKILQWHQLMNIFTDDTPNNI